MKPKKSNSSGRPATPPTHEQITERAHTLWLEEGKPAGRELHHWLEAERQLAAGAGGETSGENSSRKSDESRREIEADKRVDGLGPAPRDPRTPKGEAL
jgi:hypothetical protein